MASTAGKPIRCKAVVTWTPGSEFKVEEVLVAPPQPGEVRLKVLYSSLCGSDVSFWKSPSPFTLPAILGHEASGIVESVGDGVTAIQPGDPVITLLMTECQKCELCKNPKTNLCELSMETLAAGVMPFDKKTRFTSLDGRPIHHFMNCSAFTQYTVLAEGNVAKVDPDVPLDKLCLLSCGVPTGWGSVWNIAKVEAGSTVAVIGLGTVGLAVVEAAKFSGASRIIAVDVETSKFEKARAFGATDCINPKDHTVSIDKIVHELVKGGVDYSFECVGKPDLILNALECCSQFGTSVIVGAVKYTELVTFSPWLLLFGRQWKSGAYGGFKAKSQIEALVQKCKTEELNLEGYITHRLPFSKLAEGFELLNTVSCVKCVFKMDE